ncbi:Mitochondrial intermediate peptidase [Rhizina undulata]
MYRYVSRQWMTLCSGCWQKQQLRRLATTVAPPKFAAASYNPVVFSSLGATKEDKDLRDIFDNQNVWKEYSTKTHSPTAPRTGLFQNKYLTSPEGFQAYANRTLKKAQRLVDNIVTAHTFEQLVRVVKDLDRLSDLLCRVIDMSDFVRSTHPDQKIVRAANEAYSAMYEYMNILNTTTGLYESLKRALGDPEVASRFSPEEKTVATILYKDFEKSGINLPAEARKKFVALSSQIAHLGPDFVNGMAPETPYLQFDSSSLVGMDPMVVRELTRRGKVTLPTVGMAVNHALRTVENDEVRKTLYLASHTSSRGQIQVLEEMLKKRAELAGLVGCNSYAEVALGDKMAQSPEAVMKFLTALADANMPAAAFEMQALTAFKRDFGRELPLQPWDKDFYTTKLVHALRSRRRTPDFISSYFSLGTVMQGLSRLFNRLYGVRFVPRETRPGETWNGDVRRLDVLDETDGHIAVVYCDLFERAGKSPNPAHFTVRCSRKIDDEEYLEEALEGEREDDGMASARRSDGSLYQLPTIALICDFSRGNPNHPTLLSFREVHTLFHEMGHALHSMLGRTALHNVAGTRCATDWAELPSVLMEHFAKAPEVLGLFARHYETDKPLPLEMIKEKLEQESILEASETRIQIILAVLDQYYHSKLPFEPNFDSTEVYLGAHRNFGLLPVAEGTSWQGFFGHLFSYGATYYAYLFDRAIAAKLWKDIFEEDPLRRAAGEKYKEEVLKWGGARSGWKCLAGVLERPELEDGGEDAMVKVGEWGSELK